MADVAVLLWLKDYLILFHVISLSLVLGIGVARYWKYSNYERHDRTCAEELLWFLW